MRRILKNKETKEIVIVVDRESGKPQEAQVEGLLKRLKEEKRLDKITIYDGEIKNTKIFAIVFEPQVEAFLEKIDPEVKRNPNKYKTKEGCKKLAEILEKKPTVLEEVKKTLKQKLINFLRI
jgi:2,3-bisphosphoglycerate-independent phosphoglycerate mutase